MSGCIFTQPLRWVGCCLSPGLLTVMAGCGKPRSAGYADVSGKVQFQGKPLPGGEAPFVAVNGGFGSIGIIDENSNYEIKAPIGEVTIGVMNRMLANRGAKASRLLRRTQEGGAKQRQPLKGQYVEIPSQYEAPATSGLKYPVKGASRRTTSSYRPTPRTQAKACGYSDSKPPISACSRRL